MSRLSQFWLKLTSLQKVSLISLALVLLALPAGLILVGQSQEVRKKAAEEVQTPEVSHVTKPEREFVEQPATSQSGQASISSENGQGPPVNLSGPEKGTVNQELKYSTTVDGKNITWVAIKYGAADADLANLDSWIFLTERIDSTVYSCNDPKWQPKKSPSFTCGDCQSSTSCPTAGIITIDKPGSYVVQVTAYDRLLGYCGATTTSKCQPKGEINLTILPKINPPTASIEGPTSGKTGESLAYSAKAKGEQLQWTKIHWAKATSDLTQGSSWTAVAENTKCNEASECPVSGSFTPKEAGEYYLAVTANNPGGPCSGNPRVAEVPGWSDCGANSRVKISVSQSKDEAGQTLNLSTGYNLVGLSVDKSNYKAADFVKELNSSFTGGSGKITYIFRYNADAKAWESPTPLTGATTTNFSVVPWEAYIVYSRASGTAKVSGGGVELPDSVRIPSDWSLWSSPITLSDIPDAKTLLEKANEQEIDLRSIWKWDAGAKQYVGHRQGSVENNFSLVAGVGYWIYNGGTEKQFSLITIPLPPVPGN